MVLFHTIEDRDNPDQIESHAPFKCIRNDAWLGDGYYFWDTFIENAHWWGKKVKPGGYVILEYQCDSNSNKLFDLQGNMNHVSQFKEIVELLRKQRLLNEKTTVPWVIEYLKKKTDFATIYEAIRIYGHYSKSYSTTVKMLFSKNKSHYLELTPAVQLCLFDKKSLNLSIGKIVYPPKYLNENVV
ncbi:MAG: hypothetical protein PHR52_13000 [Fermentimonas sp.]|nr:hypothetical protein [Fermentimonas sp.]